MNDDNVNPEFESAIEDAARRVTDRINWLIVLQVCLLATVVAVAVFVFYKPERPYDGSAETNLRLEQLKVQQQIEKQAWEIRLRVQASCVERGGIPVVNGPTVDCKKGF